MANIFVNLVPTAGNGVGAAVDVSAMGDVKTVTVQGVFTGVVTVEYSEDGGTTFAQIATFAAGGKKTVTFAAQFMRVRRAGVAAVAAGLPDVDVASDDIGQLFANLPVPAGNGTGAAVDVSALGTLNTVVVGGTFTGNVVVEISEDNVRWTQCLFFDKGGGGQTKSFVAQFMRVRRIGVIALIAGTPLVDVGAANDPTGGGGDNTLDQAYDQGGAGAGRIIVADAGAVVIQSTAADDNNVLEISKNPAGAQSGNGINVTMGANATGFAANLVGNVQVGSLPQTFFQRTTLHVGEIYTDPGASIQSGAVIEPHIAFVVGATNQSHTAVIGLATVDSTNTQNWTNKVGLSGFQSLPIVEAGVSGTLTGIAGFYHAGTLLAAGTLTNEYGVFVDTLSATTTNSFGVFVETPTGGATLNDAIHVVGGRTFLGGDFQHDGTNLGFYTTAAIAQQAGVAVSAAGVHAACVALGLFTGP